MPAPLPPSIHAQVTVCCHHHVQFSRAHHISQQARAPLCGSLSASQSVSCDREEQRSRVLSCASSEEAALPRGCTRPPQVLPEAAERDTTTTLLVDPRTGRILRHDDSWDPPPPLLLRRMPWAWRRLNGACAAAVARMMGFQRLLSQAEERARWWEGSNGCLA